MDAQPVCEGATKWNGASDEPVPRAGGHAQVRSKINIIHNQIQFRFCVYGSAYCFFFNRPESYTDDLELAEGLTNGKLLVFILLVAE